MLLSTFRQTFLTIAKYVCQAPRVIHLFVAIAIGCDFNSPHSTFGLAILPPALSTDSKYDCLIHHQSPRTDHLHHWQPSVRINSAILFFVARYDLDSRLISAGIPISNKLSRVKGLLILARPSKIAWALLLPIPAKLCISSKVAVFRSMVRLAATNTFTKINRNETKTFLNKSKCK